MQMFFTAMVRWIIFPRKGFLQNGSISRACAEIRHLMQCCQSGRSLWVHTAEDILPDTVRTDPIPVSEFCEEFGVERAVEVVKNGQRGGKIEENDFRLCETCL